MTACIEYKGYDRQQQQLALFLGLPLRSMLSMLLPQDLTISLSLPPNLQLNSLQLSYLKVQLPPGHGFQGVLGCAGVNTLKKLRLSACELLNEAAAEQLTAALSGLPAVLEPLCINLRPSPHKAHFHTTALLQVGSTQIVHLPMHSPEYYSACAIDLGLAHAVKEPSSTGRKPLVKILWRCSARGYTDIFRFSLYLLLQFQELTYLELNAIWLRGPGGATPVVQPLEALTLLVDLRIAADAEPSEGGVGEEDDSDAGCDSGTPLGVR